MTAPAAQFRAAQGETMRCLWLVRHARPLVGPGICYGSTEVAADARATAATARMLARVVPPGAAVRCSPRRRCTALAERLLALRPDLPWQPDARLAEMDFGCWEGCAWSAIPRVELERWSAQFSTLAFGGAESAQQVLERVGTAWDEARTLSGTQVWLTHAGVVRCALLLAAGIRRVSRAEQWPAQALAFGGITRLALADQASTT